MPSLTSLPTESLFIFQSCDNISQAIALSSTCKRLQAVYSSNAYSVLGRLGPRDIPAFDDAVARITRIVLKHFQKGRFPPVPFPLDSLSIEAQEPFSDDVRQVFDWEHLIRCIENICLHNTEWGKHCYYCIRKANVEKRPPPEWLTWRDNFRRSMYQSLLMGAVLCRAYQAPLAPLNKDDLPKHFLEDCDKRLNDPDEPLMKSDEMAYLLKYPVFNFEAYDDHNSIYEQLADFLRQEAKHRPPCKSVLIDMYPEDATADNLDQDHAKALYAIWCNASYRP